MELLSSSTKPSAMPSVQPFHSIIYPFSLAELLQIARKYAGKAKLNVALTDTYFIHKVILPPPPPIASIYPSYAPLPIRYHHF